MKIKELDRTANVSWSPQHQYPTLLAVGTAAQQLDASFSTNATLELYNLNLTDPGLDLEPVASVTTKQRFHKLTWGAHGQNAGTLVGGCDGGVIQIYNANKLLNNEEALVSQTTNHKGPVKALDFNAYQNNLLASAASESEIFIWDLNTPKPMTPGSKSQPLEEISSIAWNRQVQHILASCFATRCVVWDLRKNDSIIKLTDGSTRVRWNCVAWNPDVATQVCLSSEDDQSPVIQLWDLRFATSPLKTLEGHQKGVLSISWCRQDSDMLLSCSKDNRILIWNPNNTVPGYDNISEITSCNQWNFDVSWCPRNPALFVSSSYDGHVSVHSLLGVPQQVQTSNKIADSFPGMDSYTQATLPVQHQVPVDLRKPPKWLKKPVGASFGFGGKLVTFDHTLSSNQEPASKTVYISQVVTEPELISRSNQLEDALHNGYYSDYCLNKADASNDSHEKELWEYLAANFQSIPRYGFLNLLGYNTDEVNMKLSKFVEKPVNARDINSLSHQLSALGRSDGSVNDSSTAFDAAVSSTNKEPSRRSTKISTSDDTDGLITQALLLGNTETAVELCLQDNRMADAIILAMTGGSELLARTQYRYFEQCTGNLSTLISAIVTDDWCIVIETCDLESWKEALAGAITHTNDESFPILCEILGKRLEATRTDKFIGSAQICYICAGNINKLVSCYTSTGKTVTANDLQDLVELVMLLKKAMELQGKPIDISGEIADLLTKYASILASQGSLAAALSYLGTSNDESIVELRDRLACSLGQKSAYQMYSQQGYPQQQQQQQQPPQGMKRRFSSQNVPQRTRTLSAGYPTSQTPQSYQQPPPAQQAPPPTTNQYFQPPQPAYGNTVQPPQPYNNTVQPQAQYNNTTQSQPSSLQSPKFNLNPVVGVPPSTQAPPPPSSMTPGPPPSNPSPGPLSGAGSVTSRSKYVVDPSVQSGPGQYPSYNQTNSYNQPGFPASSAPGYLQQQNFPSNGPMSTQPPIPTFPSQASSLPPSQTPPIFPQSGFATSQPPLQSGFPNQSPSQTSFSSQPSFQPSFPNQPPSQPGFLSQPVGQPGFPAQSASQPTSQPSFAPAFGTNPPSFNNQPPPSTQSFNPPPPASQAPPGWNDPPALGPPKSVQPKPEISNQNPIIHPLFGAAPAPTAPVNGYAPQGYPDNTYNQQPPLQQQHQQQQQVPSFQNYNQPQQPPQAIQRVEKRLATPPPKQPIPEEHADIQIYLDELAYKCSMAANNPQSKRKLEDVHKKLEVLYDSLRENKLSMNTLQGLHQVVQLIQNGDYQNGLMLHTQMVSGPDFSQIASFMPGIKVLLQSALQLQVYL